MNVMTLKQQQQQQQKQQQQTERKTNVVLQWVLNPSPNVTATSCGQHLWSEILQNTYFFRVVTSARELGG